MENYYTLFIIQYALTAINGWVIPEQPCSWFNALSKTLFALTLGLLLAILLSPMMMEVQTLQYLAAVITSIFIQFFHVLIITNVREPIH